MRILLLTALMGIPASAASVPLFTEPTGPVPVIATPPLADEGVINPNPAVAMGLCPPTAAQVAADRVKRSGGQILHKLTELPPADAYSAVYRRIDGCEAPIVIRYDVTGLKGSAHK